MNVKNLMLMLVMICYVSVASYAQNGNYSDRFAYSYGLIVGDNVKKTGLDAATFPFESFVKGIDAAFASKEPKVMEKAAQEAVNVETEMLKGEKKVAAPRTGFAYNYGVLVGMNWRLFNLERKAVSTDDFKTGLLDMLNNQKVSMTVAQAQREVSVVFQLQEEKKQAAKLRANSDFLQKNAKRATVESLASGVQYEVLTKGKGKQVGSNDKITLAYTGMLMDGTIFESSQNHGGAIEVTLNGVIGGWKEVLPMMKEGDKWKVFIPTHLGYGSRIRGNVPGNSLLIYELEVIKVAQ